MIRWPTLLLPLAMLLAPVPQAPAQPVPLPQLPDGAVPTASVEDGDGSWSIATGPAEIGALPPQQTVAGARQRTAWRLAGGTAEAVAVMRSFEAGLAAAGWQVRLACAAAVCGGYDFRHALDVLPLPDMYVDLSDYLYLSATPGTDSAGGAVEAIVSPSADGVQVQVTRIWPPGADGPDLPAPARRGDAPPAPAATAAAGTEGDVDWTADTLGAALTRSGRVILTGLDFGSGGTAVASDGVPVLRALAEWLAADPARRIALVGHSDWTGALDANRALSAARATGVADWLLSRPDVRPAQVETHGIGYLAPITGNATAPGQARNRRVEAVLLPPG